MQLKDLNSKSIAVLGFGLEGQAICKWLVKHGHNPEVCDKKELSSWGEEETKLLHSLNLNVTSGNDYLKDLERFDIVFRSPGIWRLTEDILKAENKGTIITSQAKWFFENTPAKIIGVTGTKGKGTTSSLIYEILSQAINDENNENVLVNHKSHIYLTGNIGKDQPFDILDQTTTDDYIVYELSSFQLQDLDTSPHVAVVLMITSEHLDVHLDTNEYHSAKQNISRFQTEQDFAVINQDYPESLKHASLTKAEKAFVSENRQPNSGAYIDPQGDLFIEPENTDHSKPYIRLKDLLLRGRHNMQNVASAILVSRKLGVPDEIIKATVSNFKGLEHRLQFVAEANGIKYYDDSFSTVPETTIAALNSFPEPIILILGGSDKKSDYSELATQIHNLKNIKAIIAIGETSEEILNSIDQVGGYKGQVFTGATDMQSIFEQIKIVSTAGDIVLLSPACASFGMFKNYRDRGDQFIEQVKKL